MTGLQWLDLRSTGITDVGLIERSLETSSCGSIAGGSIVVVRRTLPDRGDSRAAPAEGEWADAGEEGAEGGAEEGMEERRTEDREEREEGGETEEGAAGAIEGDERRLSIASR